MVFRLTVDTNTFTMATGFNRSKTKNTTKRKGLLVKKKLTIQWSPSSGSKSENKALYNNDITNWAK